MVLLRHLLGDALRRLRLRQGRTLREVSASARVSLGYLSEVERGQKEASSELLAAICSALGTPLSQVLREVSDNFALAELQSEPVFADVIEPPIEVAGVSHGPAREDDQGRPDEVPVGPVASERLSRPAEQRVPAGAGSRMSAGPAQLGAEALGHSMAAGHSPIGSSQAVGQVGTRHISSGQLSPGQKLTVPGRMPINGNLTVGEPAFDQVTRTVREITNMVPV
jgi:XRE family transcriptional regulator, stress-response regulator